MPVPEASRTVLAAPVPGCQHRRRLGGARKCLEKGGTETAKHNLAHDTSGIEGESDPELVSERRQPLRDGISTSTPDTCGDGVDALEQPRARRKYCAQVLLALRGLLVHGVDEVSRHVYVHLIAGVLKGCRQRVDRAVGGEHSSLSAAASVSMSFSAGASVAGGGGGTNGGDISRIVSPDIISTSRRIPVQLRA